VLAGGAARRLRLPGKGELAVGADGDLALVDTRVSRVLEAAELRDRHRLSPYVGRTMGAQVVTTILRGQVIAQRGEPCGEPRGRLLTPQPRAASAPQNPSR
jgi:dihydroorotase-like cyclic amidohydrolase